MSELDEQIRRLEREERGERPDASGFVRCPAHGAFYACPWERHCAHAECRRIREGVCPECGA